jgi:type IV secretion system protein VirB7
VIRPLILFILALALALAACSSGEELAACKGPVFPLNADHWQADPADLATPPAGRNG